LEIEQGKEAYIPDEICHDTLPCNFWYYDSVLAYIQDTVSEDKKDLQ